MRTTTLRSAMAAAIVASGLATPFLVQAQESPWLVRVRAAHVDSANKDSTGLGLSIKDKFIPEVDATYFFTPNLAAELVVTLPQKHKLRSNGTEIGSVKYVSPNFFLQYHFTSAGAFKPYLGAGVNYTRFSSASFNPLIQATLQPSVEKSSAGLAVQAGFDYEIAKGTYLNVDVKKVQVRSDIKAAGVKLGEFKVDPLLIGVGVGWRF